MSTVFGYSKINSGNHDVFSVAKPVPDSPNTIVYSTVSKHEVGGLDWKLSAGYNINESFGVEGGYIAYNASKYASTQVSRYKKDDKYQSTQQSTAQSKINIDSSVFTIAAKESYDIDKVELYAREGWAYVTQKTKYSKETTGVNLGFTVPVNNDELATPSIGTSVTHGVLPFIGVGIGINVTDNVNFSYSWTHIFGRGTLKASPSAIADLDLVAMEVRYTFN